MDSSQIRLELEQGSAETATGNTRRGNPVVEICRDDGSGDFRLEGTEEGPSFDRQWAPNGDALSEWVTVDWHVF